MDALLGTTWMGCLGIALILGAAYLFSNNRQAIQWRLVINGLALQVMLAIFILKVPFGQTLFHALGQGIDKLLSFSEQGAAFVFGPLVSQPQTLSKLFGAGQGFLFAFHIVPTIIFVSALVSIAYHVGLMQRLVQVVAWLVAKLMGASGAEAVSNAASIFVGQVEAQLLIRPYLATMTQSELLAVMSGSMACIAGSVMAIYIQMGVPAEYLLTASLMAAPGALVISKIFYPETETSMTQGSIRLAVEKHSVNLVDAAARGAADGMKIGINVCAMLIGFIALINLLDFGIASVGQQLAAWGLDLSPLGLNLQQLSLKALLGSVFSVLAVFLGVPLQEAGVVGGLMGTKMVLNEFVAYADLAPLIAQQTLSPKAIAIASFALCGFANFSSVAMQVGGIGELAPPRKADLARLGMMALVCGSLASYVSSALAGVLISLPNEGSGWLLGGIFLAALGVMLWSNRKWGAAGSSAPPSAETTPDEAPSVSPKPFSTSLPIRKKTPV